MTCAGLRARREKYEFLFLSFGTETHERFPLLPTQKRKNTRKLNLEAQGAQANATRLRCVVLLLAPCLHPAFLAHSHHSHLHVSVLHTDRAPAGPGSAQSDAPNSGTTKLLGASTAQGPLITSSVEEGAQAQQVLQVMDNYDFR
jgi:hypothetical protein